MAEEEIPWSEKIPLLSINPNAATLRDIANLASQLMQSNHDLAESRTEREREHENFLAVHRDNISAISRINELKTEVKDREEDIIRLESNLVESRAECEKLKVQIKEYQDWDILYRGEIAILRNALKKISGLSRKTERKVDDYGKIAREALSLGK